MAIETNGHEAQSSAAGLKFPFPSSSEWLESFTGNPGKLYGVWNQALNLTATRLQEQADYAKALSECTDPSEAIKYSADFVQNAWKKSFSDGSKFFEAWQTSLSSAAQGK